MLWQVSHPLGPSWAGLWKSGERAMDGPFSPAATRCCVGTARLEQVRPRLARRAVPRGCVLLATFLAQTRKVARPVGIRRDRETTITPGEIRPPAFQGTMPYEVRLTAWFRPFQWFDFEQCVVPTGDPISLWRMPSMASALRVMLCIPTRFQTVFVVQRNGGKKHAPKTTPLRGARARHAHRRDGLTGRPAPQASNCIHAVCFLR